MRGQHSCRIFLSLTNLEAARELLVPECELRANHEYSDREAGHRHEPFTMPNEWETLPIQNQYQHDRPFYGMGNGRQCGKPKISRQRFRSFYSLSRDMHIHFKGTTFGKETGRNID